MIRKETIGSLGAGLMIGLLGVLISLIPYTAAWEEGIGLETLFKLRGRRTPPQEIVIVSINGQTGEQLGLGEEIPAWPRTLHGRLIDRLHDAGVAVIVFDIFFKKPRDAETDNLMADAMRRAGNVLLVAYLQQQQILSGQQTLYVERLALPTDSLAQAAVDVAPFVLPKVPVRVSRFWTFNGENELISLPAAALQRLADPDGTLIRQLLQAIGEDLALSSDGKDRQNANHWLRGDAQLRKRLLEAVKTGKTGHPPNLPPLQRQRLTALLALYENEPYPYLNFYGPPGSIPTLPIQEILSATPQALEKLKGKVVFIGYAGAYQPKQKDGFYTVFSQPNGLDLSGVEIAATAFANLLRMETLSPPGAGGLIALLLGYGLVITLLFRYLPGMPGITTGIAVASGYCYLVYLLFAQHNLWLPWFVPLALQTPLALILSLIRHYRQMRLSREQLRELFGYYLPGDVIDRLAQGDSRPMTESHSAFGVCLASDAQGYTKLAETMEPQALQAFLNRYYELLFAPVRARDGVVSDVVGDAMLAIWPAIRLDRSLQQKACEAALAIGDAIQASDLEPKLFTRIGLHAGELVMSHVGAIDHFEYRAVGDMVNTASRIENLNKLLGTSILASGDFVEGLQGMLTRELGRFLVAGKQRPITLYEIAATHESATPELRALHAAFAEALAEWKRDDRSSACQKFEAILRDHPDDGPSRYYLQQYSERRSNRKNPLG
ncbi:MAG: adenylate/guanylate cyclase domain-containing protein [Candidatus Thiodiazotropha sp. (ex Epidulcina cf. delphinae)]|nr:adenylate/guanylate cyclase domain-containing protein [Candidatus Thiodiazotropha sp. (ex Epidulcina cf. delphinae)]